MSVVYMNKITNIVSNYTEINKLYRKLAHGKVKTLCYRKKYIKIKGRSTSVSVCKDIVKTYKTKTTLLLY